MLEQGKVILITGCGHGGIGEALALEYRRQNSTVLATLLTHENRSHLTEAGIQVFDLDVTSDEEVSQLAEAIAPLCSSGGLNVLVNNAGICYTMTGIDTDVSAAKAMFDVNLFEPMRMVRHFHPLLIRAGSGSSNGATIVNIGSAGGFVPYLYGSAYNAGKAALHHWGSTLRVGLQPLGVSVLNIVSGNFGTNIHRTDADRKIPSGRDTTRWRKSPFSMFVVCRIRQLGMILLYMLCGSRRSEARRRDIGMETPRRWCNSRTGFLWRMFWVSLQCRPVLDCSAVNHH